jgi:hypothetical protein
MSFVIGAAEAIDAIEMAELAGEAGEMEGEYAEWDADQALMDQQYAEAAGDDVALDLYDQRWEEAARADMRAWRAEPGRGWLRPNLPNKGWALALGAAGFRTAEEKYNIDEANDGTGRNIHKSTHLSGVIEPKEPFLQRPAGVAPAWAKRFRRAPTSLGYTKYDAIVDSLRSQGIDPTRPLPAGTVIPDDMVDLFEFDKPYTKAQLDSLERQGARINAMRRYNANPIAAAYWAHKAERAKHPAAHPAHKQSHPLPHRGSGGYAHSIEHLPWVIKHPPLIGGCCGRKELKYKDVNSCVSFGTALVTAGLIHSITQGDGDGDRAGRHIRVHHIEVRGVCTSLSETTGGPAFFRVLWMVDQQCNGALPANGDFLQSPSSTMNGMLSNFNLNYASRFDVIHDWLGVQQEVRANYAEGKTFHFSKDLDLDIHYDASTGAITDVTSNNIFWGYQAIMSDGNDFAGQLYTNVRIFFTDE